MDKEALLYERLDNNAVRCNLCSHRCKIAEHKFGFCGVRENIRGTLYTRVYGDLIAMHVDPVEKKPLYHFLPGSSSFSIATIGCNFRCDFCQNWEISQRSFKGGEDFSSEETSPQEIVSEAIKNNCQSISYTYTEPTVFFEYALDTAKLAKEKGLRNIFVTNGYMTKECLEIIRPYLDAANVDLKFFREESYRRLCKGSLKPVLDSIRLMKEIGIWVEITTLVVPKENDSPEELKEIADFIFGIDKNIPWHVSRFHPDYKFNQAPPTAEATLKMAQETGFQAGLNFVYAGNVYGWGNDTFCPGCKKLLIKRKTFNIFEYNIKQDKCFFCGMPLAGIFNKEL